MANNSSISAQGIVVSRGISENFFTTVPSTSVYPVIEGFFEYEGFPGGFDTKHPTDIKRASGSDTESYDPATYTIDLFEFHWREQQAFLDSASNFPPLSGVTEVDKLPSGESFNHFVITDIQRASGSDTASYDPATYAADVFEYLADNHDDFINNNSNFLESYAPPISGS